MATTTLRPTQGPSVPTSSRTEAVRSDAGARLPIPPTHTHCADRPNEMRGAAPSSTNVVEGNKAPSTLTGPTTQSSCVEPPNQLRARVQLAHSAVTEHEQKASLGDETDRAQVLRAHVRRPVVNNRRAQLVELADPVVVPLAILGGLHKHTGNSCLQLFLGEP